MPSELRRANYERTTPSELRANEGEQTKAIESNHHSNIPYHYGEAANTPPISLTDSSVLHLSSLRKGVTFDEGGHGRGETTFRRNTDGQNITVMQTSLAPDLVYNVQCDSVFLRSSQTDTDINGHKKTPDRGENKRSSHVPDDRERRFVPDLEQSSSRTWEQLSTPYRNTNPFLTDPDIPDNAQSTASERRRANYHIMKGLH